MTSGEPVKAGFVTINRTAVPLTVALSGQAVAEKSAAIRPLVDGMITDILYKPGDEVTAGSPLFQIEQRSYIASLEQARANQQSADAAIPAARQTLRRYQQLSGTGVSRADVEQARAQWQQAVAESNSAKAAVKTAQINLDRTTIRSPIDGQISVANVSIGDLVTAAQSDSLARVIQLDPISVDLAETSSRYLAVRRMLSSGQLQPGNAIKAELVLENGEKYERNGTVENVGRSVSASTGTLNVRVRFDNPDGLILPGVFLRARLTLGTIDGYLVPQLAAEPLANGSLSVWTVDAQNKVSKLTLKPEGTHNSAWIVTTGLADGTRLLVDNLDRLRTGTTVTPQPVQINEQGVVVGKQPGEQASSSN